MVTQVDLVTGRSGSLLHTPVPSLPLLNNDRALVSSSSSNDDFCEQVWRRALTEHVYTDLVELL